MAIAILCASIQDNATSLIVADAIRQKLKDDSEIVTIDDFDKIFSGRYIALQNATPGQRQTLEYLSAASVIIFVVPTYYRSMPGVLKNFFDIVDLPSIYKDKTIAVVASNHKNQDYGARHAMEVIQGILAFYQIKTTIVPEIIILNHQAIDDEELSEFETLLRRYTSGS
jgi:NAD(P)H-dependent FMN reductase